MTNTESNPPRARRGDPAAPAAPAEPAEPAEPGQAGDKEPGKAKPDGALEQIKIIGGLAALGIGLLALVLVLVLAVVSNVDSEKFAQLATTVVGVIGSIVGAYFGVKIGTDGTQKALEAQRQEAARSQIFAAHLPPDEAKHALDLAFRPGGPSAPRPNPPEEVAQHKTPQPRPGASQG